MIDIVKRVAAIALLLLALAYLGHVFGVGAQRTFAVGSDIPAEAVGGHWTVYR